MNGDMLAGWLCGLCAGYLIRCVFDWVRAEERKP